MFWCDDWPPRPAPFTTSPFLPPAPTSGWLWLLPRLAFVLFIAAVVTLLILSHRAERDEQRATLISDILWLEQNLMFQFTRNEEQLGRIVPQVTTSPTRFDPFARSLLDNGSGIRRVLWLNPDGSVRQSLPVQATLEQHEDSVRLAGSLGRAVYGTPYATDHEWRFNAYAPIYQDGLLAGTAVATYSLSRLLESSIPWWFAERYRVVVTDGAGKTLAARSKVEVAVAEDDYVLALEPPGHELALQAMPYRQPTSPTGLLLSAALVVLAVVVLWSLWALRRHVHRRLAVEHALRQEYAFRQAMGDSLQTGLRARDLEGRITYVNPAFCQMVGWSAEELIGRAPPMPYWVDAEIDATRALHDRILAGQGPEHGFEIRLKRRNGEVFPVLIHEAQLIDARGGHTGWMSSIIDISDQKRAEDLARQQHERLQATARLITMGEMASSLAHELNQPLAAIAGYNAGCLNLLASGQADSHEIERALKKSAEQAQRAGQIIRRIYDFVRRAEPKAEPCDIGSLTQEVVALVETDARRSGIHIQTRVESGLPIVCGDRILLAQVLLNLVRNAIDAEHLVSHERKSIELEVRADIHSVLVSVADNGIGIPDDLAPRLFEPLFTTKTEGMGMGLNICRSVVEGHHGRLWFESRPEGGTVFFLRLPVETP
jgi:two-component system, LuxR family, sensor histidine kinase DctS